MKTKVKKKVGKKSDIAKLQEYLGPQLMDMVVKSKISSWKGKCYTTANCNGIPTASSVTVAECKALSGKSWKGNWTGAGCICNI